MPIDITCPSCEKKISVPDKAVGGRIMCTKCGEIIPVPKSLVPRSRGGGEEEIASYKTEVSPGNFRQVLSDFRSGLTRPQGLGICGLCLALLSIALICYPPLAIAISSLALLLNLVGLSMAWYRRDKKAMTFPLAGIAASILSLVLALLPSFSK